MTSFLPPQEVVELGVSVLASTRLSYRFSIGNASADILVDFDECILCHFRDAFKEGLEAPALPWSEQ